MEAIFGILGVDEILESNHGNFSLDFGRWYTFRYILWGRLAWFGHYGLTLDVSCESVGARLLFLTPRHKLASQSCMIVNLTRFKVFSKQEFLLAL